MNVWTDESGVVVVVVVVGKTEGNARNITIKVKRYEVTQFVQIHTALEG